MSEKGFGASGELSGFEEGDASSDFDGVIAEPFVEPAEQGEVDSCLYSVWPLRGLGDGEQAPMQFVHDRVGGDKRSIRLERRELRKLTEPQKLHCRTRGPCPRAAACVASKPLEPMMPPPSDLGASSAQRLILRCHQRTVFERTTLLLKNAESVTQPVQFGAVQLTTAY